jgi:Ca-activated chloride channel homolog
MKKFVWTYLCFCSMAVLIAYGADGQQSSGVIRVEARSVEVYATIYDQKGHYVDNLSRDRFELFEDGQVQPITSFEANVEALSCAILLDTTGSMADALPHVKNSISKLIDDLGPQDSVAIYTFDARLAIRQEFTKDKVAAKRAMLRTRAQGRTALFDAIAETTLDVARRPGKKVLVVFTDGDDNASILNAQAAVTRAKRVGIPLYAIAEGDATHSANLKALLGDLSERTGGATYQANKASDIEQVFGKISQNLQHLYMISYQPPSGPTDGRWRKIDVAVKGVKDYRVRAKEGYFP